MLPSTAAVAAQARSSRSAAPGPPGSGMTAQPTPSRWVVSASGGQPARQPVELVRRRRRAPPRSAAALQPAAARGRAQLGLLGGRLAQQHGDQLARAGARARPRGASAPRRSPRPSRRRAGRCRRRSTRPGGSGPARRGRPPRPSRRAAARRPGRPRGRRTGARRACAPRAARRARGPRRPRVPGPRPRSGSRISATNWRSASVTPVRTPCPKLPSSGRAYSRHLDGDRGQDLVGDGAQLGLDHVRHARGQRPPGLGRRCGFCHLSEQNRFQNARMGV